MPNRNGTDGILTSGPTLLGKYISMAWMPTLEGLLGISKWVIFVEYGRVCVDLTGEQIAFLRSIWEISSFRAEDNNYYNLARPATTDARDPDRSDDYHRSIPVPQKCRAIWGKAHLPQISAYCCISKDYWLT